MKEGIIATRIAAHAVDIAKGIPKAREWENQMSEARANIDFTRMVELAIDPEKASHYRQEAINTGARRYLYNVRENVCNEKYIKG
jgi:phosphomethylpyrimidine synthase